MNGASPETSVALAICGNATMSEPAMPAHATDTPQTIQCSRWVA